VRDKIVGAVDGIKETISGIGDAISNIPGAGVIGGIASHIPGFDVGGVVPGPVGSPQLILAHGGETVVPTHDPAAMRSMSTDYVAPTRDSGGGGGDTYVTVDMRGAVIADQRQFEDMVADAWNRAVRTTGRVNINASAVRR
jgi:hypothetical protein